MNQIINFEELECGKYSNKPVKVKRQFNNMGQVMDIVRLKKFNFLKKEVEQFG